MRLFLARILKRLFTCRFFRKRYYGIICHIIQPLNLFRGVTQVTDYDKDLKIKLDLDEWIQQQIYFLGYFDPTGIRFIRNQLYEGEIFIDIGANVGAYSLIASRLVGKSGKVIAFEPASKSFLRLLKNISLNGITNIITERLAVIDRSTQTDLYISGSQNLGMSSIYHHDCETGITEKVEAISLDDYVEKKGISKISLIKIDIEGAEFLALKGMKKVLINMRPKVLVEIKKETLANAGFSEKDVLELFEKAGYSRLIIDDRGNISGDLNRQAKDYYNYVFLPDTPDRSMQF
jgi:FkbM family methyltransferase